MRGYTPKEKTGPWFCFCGRSFRQSGYCGGLRKRRSTIGDDRIVGRRRREFAAAAFAQKLVERRLDPFLDRIRTAIAHVGVLELRIDDTDPGVLPSPAQAKADGIGLEVRVFRAKRQDLQLVAEHEG